MSRRLAYEFTSAAVLSLASGASATFDARGLSRLTVVAGSGAVTVVRVDSKTASGDSVTLAHNRYTVAASAMTTIAVDWPFYNLANAAGTARYVGA